ncbi:MAG: hypothetical protein GF411_03095 [Candidatus Lokiarchaeota archaeon]|nr:hypothetical protein [Candidatus Lokiarchaeota archaeon]
MKKWKKARKKPVLVEFREVEFDEHGVETLEGYKPCNKDEHFIIRGVEGEVYPIKKSIFFKTYIIEDDIVHIIEDDIDEDERD